MKSQIFKTSYFQRIIRGDYNPFTPDQLKVDDHVIEHSRRNWYLISVDKQVYHFQNIIGVDVNKALFGATVTIQTTGSGKVEIKGFSKSAANKIVEHCRKFITKHSHRSSTESLTEAITAVLGNNKGTVSVADELKKLKDLLDNGVINQQEFDLQKQKLIS